MDLSNFNQKTTEKHICTAIRLAEQNIKHDYPILKYQNSIGTFFFVGATGIIFLCWMAYYVFIISNIIILSLLVIVITIAISILHELEHDLIHNLYFKRNPFVQNIMFSIIWILKLNANPWWRRKMHLNHHMHSGQTNDVEERLIGLGLPLGHHKLMVTMNPFGALLVSKKVSNDAPILNLKEMIFVSTPIFATVNILNVLFMLDLLSVTTDTTGWIKDTTGWITDFHILLFLPNFIRQSCLVFMSNSSHYYGDIPKLEVFYQNQILDHWSIYIFQLFCCNFGATHVMHHYIPNQPFYVRQLCYSSGVKEKMIEFGVRINDFASVSRANRYNLKDTNKSQIMQTIEFYMFAVACFTFGTIFYFAYNILVIIEVPLNLYYHFTKQ